MTAPRWLDEEPWLQKLLGWFLDRLQTPRITDVTRRVTSKTIPELYKFDGDSDYRWQLMEDLAKEYQLFTITYNQTLPPSQVHYHSAQLRLNAGAEDLLRQWLNRPQISPETLAWQQAVASIQGTFVDQGQALLQATPIITGRSPTEMVGAFADIKRHLNLDFTLREISAKCFWGDSKFLDNRKELLQKLFGDTSGLIHPRPLLLTVWAPSDFQSLLIVENQDTFLRLVDTPPNRYALLYSGGFRASASRLTSQHTRFAFLPGSYPGYFQAHWLTSTMPTYFWGDLDFAAMAILKSLKQSLPNIEPWLPGYQAMQQLLVGNKGHSAEQALKSNQTDPGLTGSHYADKVLLPEIRKHCSFVDQEAVTPKYS